MGLKLDALYRPKVIIEALTMVNARFRAMSCLKEIIVEVYDAAPSDYLRRKKQNGGWTIRTTKYLEDSNTGSISWRI